MKPIITLSFVAMVVLAGLSFSFHTDKGRSEPGFAVVELFTSEGCSSCPPADEAMIRLAKEFPDHVYFLGYHVDYWNYIGWRDEFSKAEFTTRQSKYGETLRLSTIYTPQAIVNGEKELVGSKQSQLRSIIQAALKDSVQTKLTLDVHRNGNSLAASVKGNYGSNTVVNIALVQLKAITHVKRGENKGRTLEHINIVRELKSVPAVKASAATAMFNIPAGLTAKDIKLVAFVQNKNNLEITGATGVLVE